MTEHIALLRGINVGGGRKVAMADLKRWLRDLGFENPRTYIASGNVVFGGWTGTGDDLEGLLEREAAARLGLETAFFVRTAAEWAELVAGNPFVSEARERPASLVAMLLKAPLAALHAEILREAISGPERIALGPRALYVDFPLGQGVSILDRDWARTRQAPLATARNWNTVLKLEDMVA